MNADDSEYAQNQAPVRELTKATGHSVRAVYLFTGMAHLAAETGDESLVQACETLWNKSLIQARNIKFFISIIKKPLIPWPKIIYRNKNT